MIDVQVLRRAEWAVAKLDAGRRLADLTPEEVAAVEAALRHGFDSERAYDRLVPPDPWA